MSFDLFQSHRNFNELCRWWSRKESDDDELDNELIYKRIPTGSFYAKEAASETADNNVIGGIMMTTKNTITIYSPDNLTAIKPNDYVEYLGDLWRVEDNQKKIARMQNSEFMKNDQVSRYWYLTLIK